MAFGDDSLGTCGDTAAPRGKAAAVKYIFDKQMLSSLGAFEAVQRHLSHPLAVDG